MKPIGARIIKKQWVKWHAGRGCSACDLCDKGELDVAKTKTNIRLPDAEVENKTVMRGRLMHEAIKKMPEAFSIGQKIRLEIKDPNNKKSKTITTGEIIYKNNSFIVVNNGKYNTAYTYTQLKLKEARLMK